MLEKLEPLTILTACTEILEETRIRIIRDLQNTGDPFEIWLSEQIEALANVTIFRRNARIRMIPYTEYKNNREAYKKMLNTPDILIYWEAKPKIALECGHRKKHYFNAYESPPCQCVEWKKQHISTPHFDLQAYIGRFEELKLPYYIAIGKPNKIYGIVELEEWKKHTFRDYNPAFETSGDNPEQSVICLQETPHHNDIETWISAIGMPQK